MKNKKKYSKLIMFTLITFGIIILLNVMLYYHVNKNYNNKIVNIISTIKEKYPEIKDDEIFDVIKNKVKINTFNRYSFDLDGIVLIKENKTIFVSYFIILLFIYLIICLVYLTIIINNDKRKEKEINEVIKIIEEINNKNYSFKMKDINEEDLSLLKNEIYKTTIMLNEISEISKKDKKELEESLEDISHQLKTPLTSILIMIDTLLDDEDMDQNTREDFLRNMKREVMNINFLVKSILKLSRLDTNTVKFISKKESVKEIINEAILNVSLLSDLKNVKIETNLSDSFIICDYKWQIEALTNILKNSIEHSYENNKVLIESSENNAYVKIIIKDFGTGIAKEDINHIFERFYKGKDSDYDSIGIGLALSKSIIEKQNGKISVASSDDGTTFTIKYFK
ncbi:MAG: HAMP domain-containing histidine kinase [Bacilli bacterium]|nr:HAMP domain-containing histidine kinase [Bacilli bacterium]